MQMGAGSLGEGGAFRVSFMTLKKMPRLPTQSDVHISKPTSSSSSCLCLKDVIRSWTSFVGFFDTDAAV